MRPIKRGDTESIDYGLLPYGLASQMIAQFISCIKSRLSKIVPRSG